jgi:hypothetical protein
MFISLLINDLLEDGGYQLSLRYVADIRWKPLESGDRFSQS